jgi:uncharacterized protein YrrD
MKLLELEENAMVRSPAGEDLGQIERFVIDPSSREVSHLVVKEGLFFKTRRLVSVDQIDHIDEKGPVLSVDADTDDLPPFETDHYVPVDDVTRDLVDPRLGEASIWRYPTIATAYYPAYPGMPIPYRSAADTTMVREVNVPDDTVVVDDDTPVESASGEVVGTVSEVVVDEDGHLAYLSVDFAGLHGTRVVPAHWIDTVRDDRVVLAVGAAALEHLEVRS